MGWTLHRCRRMLDLQSFILPGIPSPVFWVCVAIAVIIQGISKSGFAGGAGILSLPLMMLVMPVEIVAASLLPILILADWNAVYHHRRNVVWRHVLAVWLPSLAGVLLGAAFWWYAGESGLDAWRSPLRRFVGVIAIAFALYILGKEFALAWMRRAHPGPRVAWIFGAAAGFTSTLAHAAGPIVSLYVYAQGLPRHLFVGTVAWTFALLNLSKLPFYLGVGLIDAGILLFDVVLIPLVPIGSWIGHRMLHAVSERLFTRIILGFTIAAGIQLVLDINLIYLVLHNLSP